MTPTIVSAEINGKPFTLETGRIARQAGGAVIARYGDSMVLVACTGDTNVRPGTDFLPLTCEYRPMSYAAGRIPGGFFKREGRPTERAILCSRLMDRPMRPLFPKAWRSEIQVIANVISHDQENATDVIAVVASSAAACISDVPFDGPIGCVRVGRVDGQWICNPSKEQIARSDFNMVVAGTRDAITMVEGGMNEAPEQDVVAGLEFAFAAYQPLIQIQDELVKLVGKAKRPAPVADDISAVVTEVQAAYGARIAAALAITGKHERRDAVAALKDEIRATLAASAEADATTRATRDRHLGDAHEKLVKKLMRKRLLDEGVRVDGRKPEQVRHITIELGVIPRAHGSALFTRGETQALVTTTLGTKLDEMRIDEVDEQGWGRFMLHYNFPPYSVGEVRRLGTPGRREVGHGALARRAVESIVPKTDYPYVIRVVSDITESNGSSSMASVCGGSLALMDAGVPVKGPVAGIAMGLVKEGEQYAILSDINGDEDHLGDMDFKVCGTHKGVTAFQLDTKIKGVSSALMQQALDQAKAGRAHILGKMAEAIESPRGEISRWAPRIVTIQISRERIKDVIGPGGKMIKSIVEQSGAQVDVEDSGRVTIASPSGEACEKAMKMIKELTQEAEIGRFYLGVVKKVVDFGAFVEIFPGTDGLIHISELAPGRVNKVTDVLQEGDEVLVKCIDVDKSGKIRLSRRAALAEGGGAQV
jgi:polyribonucleotide nucleotidyltransferase